MKGKTQRPWSWFIVHDSLLFQKISRFHKDSFFSLFTLHRIPSLFGQRIEIVAFLLQ